MASVKINGMSCGHCVASVTKALTEIDGISEVQVDLGTGLATFQEEKEIALETIKDAISKIGFEVAN